jgi:hypothetical protein
MAQIRAKARTDAETRKAWKFRLIRLMYDRGYERKTILELFRVIDWMIRLPDILEAAFRQEIFTYEESKQMPYVTTVERAGIAKGYRQGEADLLLWQIEKKFGKASAQDLRERVESADSDTLRLWSERILTADTPDAIFH